MSERGGRGRGAEHLIGSGTTTRPIHTSGWWDHLSFWGVHAAAVNGACASGWSGTATAWLAGSYAVRMFAITAGYHRYFSHRAFKTSRAFQFVPALLAMTSAQQCVLWWASHHNAHHKFSDRPDDVHSSGHRGFWWSHAGWIFGWRHHDTDLSRIKDLASYPELRLLDRIDVAVTIGWGEVIFAMGGPTALGWSHFVSLVVAWHVTFCINPLAHVWGTRRYATSADSRNNTLLAVLTFDEGLHNNHHHYTAGGAPWILVVADRHHVLHPEGTGSGGAGVGRRGRAEHVRRDEVAPAARESWLTTAAGGVHAFETRLHKSGCILVSGVESGSDCWVGAAAPRLEPSTRMIGARCDRRSAAVGARCPYPQLGGAHISGVE